MQCQWQDWQAVVLQNAFQTRLKLIWPRSSLKPPKWPKNAFFAKSSRSQWVNGKEHVTQQLPWCWPQLAFLLAWGLPNYSRPGEEQFPVHMGSAAYCCNLCVLLHVVEVLLFQCLGCLDQVLECFSVFSHPPLPFIIITLLLLSLLLLLLLERQIDRQFIKTLHRNQRLNYAIIYKNFAILENSTKG